MEECVTIDLSKFENDMDGRYIYILMNLVEGGMVYYVNFISIPCGHSFVVVRDESDRVNKQKFDYYIMRRDIGVVVYIESCVDYDQQKHGLVSDYLLNIYKQYQREKIIENILEE